MSGRIVIAGYKPKPGKEKQLEELMRTHVARLRKEGLVTDRESIVMRSEEGTILEVFEWKSNEAIEKAHSNPEVLKMWEEYAQVCDYVPATSVKEISELFSNFEPLQTL